MTDRDEKPSGAPAERPSKSPKPPIPRASTPPPAGGFKLKLPGGPRSASTAPRPADSKPKRKEPETLSALDEPVSHAQPFAASPPSGAAKDKYIGAIIDGRYKVLELLGEGGMGVVYRCRRRVFDTEVAVKILRSDFAKDPEATERFVTEAKAASAIGHQHIVHVIDFGELPDGSVYFAMEYLHGRTLGELIESGELLGSARIAAIGCQIAEGLSAAHQAGIVHRDLKPENVFIIDRGGDFAKILDFGIAKVVGVQNKITRAGAIFGTPHYMAPEQCRGTTVDERTDVYALGVLLYEMAVGKPPFDADNPLGILSQHLNEAPVPPSQLDDVPSPPPGLEAVILKCLAKEPEERFQRMSLVAHALGSVQRGEPGEELPIDVNLDSTEPPPPDAESSQQGLAGRPPAQSAPFLLQRRSLVDLPPASRPTPPPTLMAVVDDSEEVHSFKRAQRGRRWPVVIGALAVIAVTAWATHGVWLPNPELLNEPMQAGRPMVLAELAPTPAPPPEPVQHRSVALVLSPIDAKVYRGRELLGTMPLSVDVKPGEKVRLTIKRDGFWSRKIVVDDSKSKILARLAPIPGHRHAVPPPKQPVDTSADEASDAPPEEATEGAPTPAPPTKGAAKDAAAASPAPAPKGAKEPAAEKPAPE